MEGREDKQSTAGIWPMPYAMPGAGIKEKGKIGVTAKARVSLHFACPR